MLKPFFASLALFLGACASNTAPQFTPKPQSEIDIIGFAPTSLSLMPVPSFGKGRGDPFCNAQPEAAFQQQIPTRSLNRDLLDRAILYYTNRARCDRGLRALTPDRGLHQIATGHSADMVRLGFFGHKSPVKGRQTVSDRMRGGGATFQAAAENLATIKRLAIKNGQSAYPLQTAHCAFSMTPYGPPLPVRSYDQIARNLVQRWLDSPGHRENLLNPIYTRHGASGVIDPDTNLCEEISATQMFAS